MSQIVRTKTGNATSGLALTLTYDEGTPLNAANGHVLILRSQCGSSLDPAPATPAGWTAVGTPVIATSGGFTVRLDYFRARGNDTINSVTVAATTSTARHGTLHAIDGITADAFEIAGSFVSSVSNATVTTRSVTVAAASVGSVVNLAALAHGSTAGGTGFAWSDGSAGFGGTSSSSQFSSRYENQASPAANTYTVTWTTAGLAAMGALAFGGVSSGPTIVHADYDAVAVADFRASVSNAGGTLTHAISPTTNVTEPSEGLFIIAQTSSAQFFTVTTTDSAGGTPPTTALTIAASANGGTGLEILTMNGGVLDPL